MDTSDLDTSTVSEVENLKAQLQIYQALNVDLSKKVQAYKIELNVTQKELAAVRNELVNEKLAVNELKRTVMVSNGQVSAFIESYLTNVETCRNRINLDVTLPGESSNDAIQFRPTSKRTQSVPTYNNLQTISEEDILDNSTAPASSTPLPATTQLRDITNQTAPATLLSLGSPESSVAQHSKTPKRFSKTTDETQRRSLHSTQDLDQNEATASTNVRRTLVVDVTDYNPSVSQMELYCDKFHNSQIKSAGKENESSVRLTAERSETTFSQNETQESLTSSTSAKLAPSRKRKVTAHQSSAKPKRQAGMKALDSLRGKK